MVSFSELEQYSVEPKDRDGRQFVAALFVKQATDQIEAAGTRPVRWYFSQEQVANYAKEVFIDAGRGLEKIQIRPEPWPGSTK